jgi:uncharacterized protein YutE (UPF0331/DUF86 family)
MKAANVLGENEILKKELSEALQEINRLRDKIINQDFLVPIEDILPMEANKTFDGVVKMQANIGSRN